MEEEHHTGVLQAAVPAHSGDTTQPGELLGQILLLSMETILSVCALEPADTVLRVLPLAQVGAEALVPPVVLSPPDHCEGLES